MPVFRSLSAILASSLLASWAVVALGQTSAKPLPEREAAKLALRAAGCQLPDECDWWGGLEVGRRVFLVTYSRGNDDRGYPVISGAGAMRVTLAADGEVLDRAGVAQP